MLRFQVVKDQMEKSGLVEHVATVGKDMLAKAIRATEKSTKITGVRGVGTLLWIDTKDGATATELQQHLKSHGVIVKQNHGKGVFTKPALTLDSSHASTFNVALGKF